MSGTSSVVNLIQFSHCVLTFHLILPVSLLLWPIVSRCRSGPDYANTSGMADIFHETTLMRWPITGHRRALLLPLFWLANDAENKEQYTLSRVLDLETKSRVVSLVAETNTRSKRLCNLYDLRWDLLGTLCYQQFTFLFSLNIGFNHRTNWLNVRMCNIKTVTSTQHDKITS